MPAPHSSPTSEMLASQLSIKSVTDDNDPIPLSREKFVAIAAKYWDEQAEKIVQEMQIERPAHPLFLQMKRVVALKKELNQTTFHWLTEYYSDLFYSRIGPSGVSTLALYMYPAIALSYIEYYCGDKIADEIITKNKKFF